MAKLSEIVAQIQQVEAGGGDASELRGKVEAAGYADRLPPPPQPQQAPQAPEPGFLDNWGRPIAETGGALVGGTLGIPGGLPGMMAGAAMGQHAAGMGMDYLQGAPAPSPEDQVISAAYGSMGAPESPLLKRAPQALRGLVPEGGLFDIGRSAGGANADMAAPTALDMAESAVQSRGGSLTPGQKGSTTGAKVEAWLEGTPFGATNIHRQRDTTRNIFGDMLDETTPNATSRDVSGERISTALEQTKLGHEHVVDMAYKQFDDILAEAGGDRLNRISMDSLKRVSQDLKDLIKRDQGFAKIVYQDADLTSAIKAIDDMAANADTNVKRIAEGLDPLPTEPTYEVIKQLRTIIGNKVDDAFGSGEKVGQQKLWATLSDDLDAGAYEIGGEAAVKARDAANKANADLQKDLKYLDPVFRNADNPTQVYDTVGRDLINNPRRAAEAKGAMGTKAWDQFVDTWLNRAATTSPGQQSNVGMFSENTFMTQLNRLKQQSPEGYALLTDGKESAIETLRTLAESMQRGDRFFNRSNTANALGAQQMASSALNFATAGAVGLAAGGPTTGAMVGAASAGGNAVLQKLLSSALTSPRMTKALEAVGSKYGDRLTIGADLARALIVSGADSREVHDIFKSEMPEDKPPLLGAENANPY